MVQMYGGMDGHMEYGAPGPPYFMHFWLIYYFLLQAKYQLQELKKLSSTDNKFKALRDATKRYGNDKRVL